MDRKQATAIEAWSSLTSRSVLIFLQLSRGFCLSTVSTGYKILWTQNERKRLNKKAEVIWLQCPSWLPAYLIARNSTFNFIFDVSRELSDQTFLKGGVTSTKLHCLVPFSGQYSLCMCKFGCNSTSGIILDITNEFCDPNFLKDELFPRSYVVWPQFQQIFTFFDLFGGPKPHSPQFLRIPCGKFLRLYCLYGPPHWCKISSLSSK